METRDITKPVGLLGAFLLVMGVFSPIVHVPGGGSSSFIDHGVVDGTALLCLALISAIFLLAQNYRACMFTGIGSIAITVNMLAYFVAQVLVTDQARSVTRYPFASTHLAPEPQYGWIVLFAGALLLALCPVLKIRTRTGITFPEKQ